MAAVKRELGSTRAAAGVALMQCVIAWIVAFIVHLIFMMAGIG
jgi:ferrous iron transport protein B